jgi:hypothetical protein
MTVTDTTYMCEACVDGDHDECNTTACACIDLEHDGDIVHGDAQSYSKAVQPRAMKAARQAIVAGQWGLADVDYDQPNPAPHRARTVYRFERQAA